MGNCQITCHAWCMKTLSTENGRHHAKDRSLGEDAQPARPGATVLARLGSLAVGLLQHVAGAGTPIKQIKISANPRLGLPLLKRKRLPKIKGCHL